MGWAPTASRFPRAIIDEAVRLLRIGGVLIMEHGDVQGEQLRTFAESSVYWEDVNHAQRPHGPRPHARRARASARSEHASSASRLRHWCA